MIISNSLNAVPRVFLKLLDELFLLSPTTNDTFWFLQITETYGAFVTLESAIMDEEDRIAQEETEVA